ncbi:MAG: VOC family protein [Sphaerochaeta sp.]|nr:VOC family protein [Sphaerochaeta sp.]
MNAKFSHVNLISRDWKTLADFYITVFGCSEKPPVRNLEGKWLDSLTGIPDTHISGIHLFLPGSESDGPTLEIFEYTINKVNNEKAINLEGYGHIAFAVEDVQQCAQLLVAHGGSLLGEVIDTEINGVGKISVVYARDPEGNVIELQKWS